VVKPWRSGMGHWKGTAPSGLFSQIERARCSLGERTGIIPFDEEMALNPWFIERLIERESAAGLIGHLVECGKRCHPVSTDS
jgi:hypothetical protein